MFSGISLDALYLVGCLGSVSRSLYSLVQGLEVCLVKADN
uniref:Uncharacterized protein n=1 Tax=Siphoviridae sp. ctNmW2 TaxID=2826306 RepID=A0A8S5MJ70_9CAUD|nr:MAG TPA: hypothetical protein [Siphoviridae sp. ctNmW2]DAO73935.1 MAG TPA: hypothetical protein [Caudoviricetes sp.]